jgi:co-chaperonin GroES (HSP10)
MSKNFKLHSIESIKPVGKKILVELNLVEEKKTEGGILLPGLHHEESRVGYVLAIGNEVTVCKVGDKILVSWTFGDVLHFPDKGIIDDTIRMGTQAAIWAILEE